MVVWPRLWRGLARGDENWLCGNGKWLFGNWLYYQFLPPERDPAHIYKHNKKRDNFHTTITNFQFPHNHYQFPISKLPISITSSVNNVVKLYKYLISNIIELHPIPKTTSFNLVYFFQLINPFLPKPTLLTRFFQRLIKKI